MESSTFVTVDTLSIDDPTEPTQYTGPVPVRYDSPVATKVKALTDGLGKWSKVHWWIEEKIDGSQLSFQVTPSSAARAEPSTIQFFSHGSPVQQQGAGAFEKAVTMLRTLKDKLNPFLVYHGEVVQKHRQNVVEYQRVPPWYIVIYDIRGPDGFFPPDLLKAECDRIGLEPIRVICSSSTSSKTVDLEASELLEAIEKRKLISQLGNSISGAASALGGDWVEGIVIKYEKIPEQIRSSSAVKLQNFKLARASKLVSSWFKEQHGKKLRPPQEYTCYQLASFIGERWNVPARFRKALQHLYERGTLPSSQASEIPTEVWNELSYETFEPLFKELHADFEKECSTLARDYLWQDLSTMVVRRIMAPLRELLGLSTPTSVPTSGSDAERKHRATYGKKMPFWPTTTDGSELDDPIAIIWSDAERKHRATYGKKMPFWPTTTDGSELDDPIAITADPYALTMHLIIRHITPYEPPEMVTTEEHSKILAANYNKIQASIKQEVIETLLKERAPDVLYSLLRDTILQASVEGLGSFLAKDREKV